MPNEDQKHEVFLAPARKETNTEIATKLETLVAEAKEIAAAGVPWNTRRAYRSQWEAFVVWCRTHSVPFLPTTGEVLVLYLTDRSKELAVSSLGVALAAITVAHREAGQTDWAATDLPGVRVFMRGLRRTKGKAPNKKEAFRLEDLARGLPKGDSYKAVRDRAILLLGFFSAMRRSELAVLECEDLKLIPTGMRIYVHRSKGDKDSTGQIISVPELLDQPELCPVRAVQDWLDVAEIEDGYLFRSAHKAKGISHIPAQAIANVVKKAASRAGFDAKDFAAHSLRSGFATSAAASDAEERDIMKVTRHRSERMVREYIQEGQLGTHHPGRLIAESLKKT